MERGGYVAIDETEPRSLVRESQCQGVRGSGSPLRTREHVLLAGQLVASFVQ